MIGATQRSRLRWGKRKEEKKTESEGRGGCERGEVGEIKGEGVTGLHRGREAGGRMELWASGWIYGSSAWETLGCGTKTLLKRHIKVSVWKAAKCVFMDVWIRAEVEGHLRKTGRGSLMCFKMKHLTLQVCICNLYLFYTNLHQNPHPLAPVITVKPKSKTVMYSSNYILGLNMIFPQGHIFTLVFVTNFVKI